MPTFSPQSLPIACRCPKYDSPSARRTGPASEMTDAPRDDHVTASSAPTRLMIVLEVGPGAPERLSAASGAASIASVILAPAVGKTLDAAAVASLVAAIQKAGAAALIWGDARLARTVKADGVHLPVSEAAEALYEDAREMLGRRFIVGLDAGQSRHDAMTAGEADADYIGFGLAPASTDRLTAIAGRLELVDWWAEIFEVPCIAFDVATPDEARALAHAGADFVAIAVNSATGTAKSPADVADEVKAFAAAITGSPPGA